MLKSNYTLKQKKLATNDILVERNICKDVRKIILEHLTNQHTSRQNKVANTNIFVFFSKDTHKAVIIRKSIIGGKRFVNMLSWNLDNNQIRAGQWLINKRINLGRASLSPNGEFFLYPITISNGPYQEYIPNGLEKLTVICRPPYFTGLCVLRSNLSQYGDVYNHMIGGKWIDDSNIIVNADYSVENGTIPQWITITSLDNYVDPSVENEKNRLSKWTLKDLKNMGKTIQVPRTSQLKKNELISAIIKENSTKSILDLSSRHDHIMLTNNDKQIDPLGRKIWTNDGYLFVNGQIIYDFMKDEFKSVCKPANYSWE
jgi:hypothetical protein